MERCDLTEADIVHLKELAAAASEGPWRGFATGILRGMTWVISNEPDASGAIMSLADAEFIAFLRNRAEGLIRAAQWVKWAEGTIEKASHDNDTWCEALREMDELRTEVKSITARLAEYAKTRDTVKAQRDEAVERAELLAENNIACADAALKAEAERDEWKARAETAEANYRFMVERAADQKLDGYRELGAKAAEAEAQRDAYKLALEEIDRDRCILTGFDAAAVARTALDKVKNGSV